MPTIKPLRSCKRLKVLRLYGEIKDPSELESIPDSVTDLVLYKSGFTQDPMPTLETLSNLTTLHLFDMYSGKKMVYSHDGFPSLQFLSLKYCRNLKEWQVEDSALSSLKGLKIEFCYNLKMVPERLKSIPPIPAIYN